MNDDVPTDKPQKFRVFLSYSHEPEDAALHERVAKVIADIDMKPMSDQRLAFGHGFLDQIQSYISHSHIFMPLVTEHSSASEWVHQEIGFAAALNVPVFPIYIGAPPRGMIQSSHALGLDSVSDPQLEERLTRNAIEAMISWVSNKSSPNYVCAEEVEERALMLAEYADQVLSIDGPHRLRQAGGLTSFSIPRERANHPIWNERYGGTDHRSTFSHKCLRSERYSLEAHAREAGCRLIIHAGLDLDAEHGPGTTCTRLGILIRFLESMKERHGVDAEQMVQLALIDKAPRHSLLLIGDWFVAESQSGTMKTGYRNTLLTRHAATVQHQLHEFDLMFDEIERRSLDETIAELKKAEKKAAQPQKKGNNSKPTKSRPKTGR